MTKTPPQSVNDWRSALKEHFGDIHCTHFTAEQFVESKITQARTLALQEAMEVVEESIKDLKIVHDDTDNPVLKRSYFARMEEAKFILSALMSLAKEPK